MEDGNETISFRNVSRDEEGLKRVEKNKAKTVKPDTLRYIEKKLVDKGVQRLERHPVDGLGDLGRPPPKMGHGGKYRWEGPRVLEDELSAPPAIDERDPYYVEGEEERGVDEVSSVVGEVEVAKAAEAKAGVLRVEIQPSLLP